MDRDISLKKFLDYVLVIDEIGLDEKIEIVSKIKFLNEDDISIIAEHEDETPYSQSFDVFNMCYKDSLVLSILLRFDGSVSILEYSEEMLAV